MTRTFIFMGALLLAACGNTDHTADDQKAADTTASSASVHSPAFNNSFGDMLSTYYVLKDALVEYDTAKANSAAAALATQAAGLPLSEVSDSTGVIRETAKNYTGTIEGSSATFTGETDLEKKKRAFQMISGAMYDLVRTVRYDGQKIYHQHCPMAFNDEESAYWLSQDRKIENPYLGKNHPKYKGSMLHCGEVTDSLDF